MKQVALALAWVLPFLCCGQYTYQNLHVDFMEHSDGLKVNTYANLRLYPVYATDGFRNIIGSVGPYTSLQEAVQKKKVKITEKNTCGSVNDLKIENLSKDTIIVICGDVIKGGQQDRIIEDDIVLAPKSGKVNLKVFCVESGRWTRVDGGEGVASSRISSVGVSNDATSNKPEEFKSYYSKGTMSLRKVVEKEKDQAQVWSKVDEINLKNKTQTATGAYTAISTSDSFVLKLNGYLKFFEKKLTNLNIIGVIAVTGNKVLGCDLFATNAIFRGQYPSLLHSYATEAILNGAPVNISTAAVKRYSDQLFKDENTQRQMLKQKGNAFMSNGKKLRVSCFD
jgi:ARG/rhodanese/phosphatase superfamily protein